MTKIIHLQIEAAHVDSYLANPYALNLLFKLKKENAEDEEFEIVRSTYMKKLDCSPKSLKGAINVLIDNDIIRRTHKGGGEDGGAHRYAWVTQHD